MSVGTLKSVVGFTLKGVAGHTRLGPDYGKVKAGGGVADVRPRPGSKGGVQGPSPCRCWEYEHEEERGRTEWDQMLGNQERPQEAVTPGTGAGQWVCFPFLRVSGYHGVSSVKCSPV